MASSRRPRSSITSLAPRSLRTFRALARVRGAFPLVATSAGNNSFRAVFVGSPEVAPAALRTPIRARLSTLRNRLPATINSGQTHLTLVLGGTSVGRRVFRSHSLRSRRTLLQGGSALLQFERSVPSGFSDAQLFVKILAELAQPLPGFKLSASFVSFPPNNPEFPLKESVAIRRVTENALIAPTGGTEPRVQVRAQVLNSWQQSLSVPRTLVTRVASPLITSVATPVHSLLPGVALPARHVLAVLGLLIHTRSTNF
jgi:hypothetical protein